MRAATQIIFHALRASSAALAIALGLVAAPHAFAQQQPDYTVNPAMCSMLRCGRRRTSPRASSSGRIGKFSFPLVGELNAKIVPLPRFRPTSVTS